MADTLVERVTGHLADEPEDVALNLVMSDQALWGQDNAPAVLDGYGPIPASVAQRLVWDAVVDERSLATLRRLYRDPSAMHGHTVLGWAIDSGVSGSVDPFETTTELGQWLKPHRLQNGMPWSRIA
jgi:hypothetical protein